MNKEQFDILKERLTFSRSYQDNESGNYRAHTSDPIFCVQSLKRVYGVKPDFSWENLEEHYYVDDAGDYFDSLEEVREYFEDEDIDEDDDRIEVYYSATVWEDINHHLTRESAERYIEENRHNLHGPRVYVKSLNRCKEMIGLIDAIIAGKLEFKE